MVCLREFNTRRKISRKIEKLDIFKYCIIKIFMSKTLVTLIPWYTIQTKFDNIPMRENIVEFDLFGRSVTIDVLFKF